MAFKKFFTLILALLLVLGACAKPDVNDSRKDEQISETVTKELEAFDPASIRRDPSQKKLFEVSDYSDLDSILSQLTTAKLLDNYGFSIEQKTSTEPIDDDFALDSMSKIKMTVINDGLSLQEEFSQSIEEEGQIFEESMKNFFIAKTDQVDGPYDIYEAQKTGDEPYYVHQTESDHLPINTDFSFESFGKMLDYNEQVSNEDYAVYEGHFLDDEVVAYMYSDNTDYVFEDSKGYLDARMVIDKKTNTIADYLFIMDFESLSYPSESQLEELYAMTDQAQDFEDYKQEYLSVSKYRARNQMESHYYDFLFNHDQKVTLTDEMKDILDSQAKQP